MTDVYPVIKVSISPETHPVDQTGTSYAFLSPLIVYCNVI